MITFVSLGNALQPFSRLLEAVVKHRQLLPSPVIIQHGYTKFQRLEGFFFVKLLPMNMFEKIIADADLIIAHCGAGTLINAVSNGKMPVVMPRRKKYGEMVDDHQVELAQLFAKQEKLVLAMEPDDLPRAIDKALQLSGSVSKKPVATSALDTVARLLQKYEDSLASRR